jgi:hypothetical protein
VSRIAIVAFALSCLVSTAQAQSTVNQPASSAAQQIMGNRQAALYIVATGGSVAVGVYRSLTDCNNAILARAAVSVGGTDAQATLVCIPIPQQ